MATAPVELSWEEVPAQTWHALLAAAPRCGLQQGWAYGRAVATRGQTVLRVVVRHAGEVVAVAQLVERRILGAVRLAHLMRGPVWLVPELRDALEPELIGRLRAELGRAVLLWTPERLFTGERLCGLRRVMTGYSTAWLDLSADLGALRAGLHGKWRNMLARAEREPVEVRRARHGRLVEWLLEECAAHRARVGYRGPPSAFIRDLAGPEPGGSGQTTLLALEQGAPVAGVLLQRHGSSATYLLAGTTPRGRELRAHHLLLWRAVTMLKEQGVGALDLGGLDTVRAPGLARFKLGLGGAVTTLAGTFLGTPVTRAGG